MSKNRTRTQKCPCKKSLGNKNSSANRRAFCWGWVKHNTCWYGRIHTCAICMQSSRLDIFSYFSQAEKLRACANHTHKIRKHWPWIWLQLSLKKIYKQKCNNFFRLFNSLPAQSEWQAICLQSFLHTGLSMASEERNFHCPHESAMCCSLTHNAPNL